MRCLPSGVSTKTALYSSTGVEAILIEAISSKLPSGWHFGMSSVIVLSCSVPVINRMMLSII